jgi:GxxExxY protein
LKVSAKKQLEQPFRFIENWVRGFWRAFVEKRIILVELKAVKELSDVHFAQIRFYLKATGLKVEVIAEFFKTSSGDQNGGQLIPVFLFFSCFPSFVFS